MTVLILTGEEDVTADMVVAHLNASGVPVVRLDPADLTAGAELSVEYGRGTVRGHLSSGRRRVSLDGIRSVWVRRPGEPAARAAEPSPWPCAGPYDQLPEPLGGVATLTPPPTAPGAPPSTVWMPRPETLRPRDANTHRPITS